MTTPQKVFLAGIGGTGMSTLAWFLKHLGWTVEGYDRAPYNLQSLQNTFRVTHHLEEALHWLNHHTYLVYTPALPNDHPLLQKARNLHLHIERRAQFLGKLLHNYPHIAIAGTHGKSSTTLLTTTILRYFHIHATALVGAPIQNHDQSGFLPGNLHNAPIIIEADEYDHAFLSLTPEISAIVSLEHEHVDHYPTEASLLEAFRQFIFRTQKAVLIDGTLAQRYPSWIQSLPKEKIWFLHWQHPNNPLHHLPPNRTFLLSNYQIHRQPLRPPTISVHWHPPQYSKPVQCLLPIPGKHFAWNTGIALSLAYLYLQIHNHHPHKILPNQMDLRALYPGLHRRMEIHYIDPFRALIDDYAHHPTEIQATIESIRTLFPDDPICIVFQPHLYSRTRAFAPQFGQALSSAEYVFVTDIEPAREPHDPNTSPHTILQHVQSWKQYVPWKAIPETIPRIRPRIVILMGAGPLNLLAQPLLTNLKKIWFPSGKNLLTTRRFAQTLAQYGRVFPYYPLRKIATLRTGGYARYLVQPTSRNAFIALLQFLDEQDIPWWVIGRGSNLLIGDCLWNAVVIDPTHALNYIHWEKTSNNNDQPPPPDTTLVRTGAGTSWPRFVMETIRQGYSGLEELAGIPGSVGGALIMNAGAYGKEVFDVLVDVLVYDRNERKAIRLTTNAIPHGYRYARFPAQIIIEARFRLHRTNPEQARQKRNQLLQQRKATQPVHMPNAGCFFKNLPDIPVGKLLDDLGFKGFTIGGAYVSPQHANFFVHNGYASSWAFLHLVETIRTQVYNQLGFLLQMEVQKAGNFGGDETLEVAP